MTTALLLTALCVAASSCNTSAPQSTDTNEAFQTSAAATAPAGTTVGINTADMFTERDYDTGSNDDCTVVTLGDGGITVNGSGASAKNGALTITAAGTYRLSGKLTSGRIVVDAESAKVHIVLDGAFVTCPGDAALHIKKADKVFLTTTGAGGSLTSSGNFPEDSKTDGAVYSKSDLTLNGAGTLTVSCESGHGIVCRDDLKITSGSYTVNAAKKGIDCKDSVLIADGSITITSGTDGIHAENSDNAEKGFVYVGGGAVTITSGSDAVDTSGEVISDGGTFTFVTGGGTANASPHADNGYGRPQDRDRASSDGKSATSCKGIKSDGTITINGGTFTINSADDAIHTGSSFNMTSGSLTATSGDDGIHADANVAVSDGIVEITESCEGIEGKVIEISGGKVSVTASDDGINAAGSETDGKTGKFSADPNALLHISGGSVTVNALGDGVDSNGTLLVSGGETYISGPVDAFNGSLDSSGKATVTGGTLIAAGSTGMAENFGSDSTQCSILCTFDGIIPGGTEILLTDSAGNILARFTPPKDYQCAVISTPDIKVGGTYTVTAGSESKTVGMTGTIYGAGSNSGFGGSGKPGR